MKRAKEILLAFTGPKIAQDTVVRRIANGYECWNFNRLGREEFISAAQKRIPPLNCNVLDNYGTEKAANSPFGLDDRSYEICSWGLLLPDIVPNSLGYSVGDILFLLNLYSPRFLRPIFFLSDFGIQRPELDEDYRLFFHDQNQAERFCRLEFVTFYRTLIEEAVYGTWQADRMAKWDGEDWRVFVASLLFAELRKGEHSKQVFTWQREAANMATILEALFTAKEKDTAEVGYRLRKRMAVLLSSWFPQIERSVKELYTQRSSFVHGTFFQDAKKQIKVKDGMARLPSPPFAFLYQRKEEIRYALAVYLHLNRLRKNGAPGFKGYRSVLEILEKSIIDLDMRARVHSSAEEIVRLL
jgi:hypothetical protein